MAAVASTSISNLLSCYCSCISMMMIFCLLASFSALQAVTVSTTDINIDRNQTAATIPLPATSLIGGNCTTDFDCGNFAYCIEARCQCAFGYITATNRLDCRQYFCRSTAACELLDPNAECVGTICLCRMGYYEDSVLQVCVQNDPYNVLSWLATVFVGTLLLSAAVVVCTLTFRSYRRREYIRKM